MHVNGVGWLYLGELQWLHMDGDKVQVGCVVRWRYALAWCCVFSSDPCVVILSVELFFRW